MSKATQWALLALGLVNVALLVVALVPELDNIWLGLLIGGFLAHALHGWYGCSFFPESEVGDEEAHRG